MKFFSDFGSCCRAPTAHDPSEKERLFINGRSPSTRRNQPRMQWLPSLSVISEESSVSDVKDSTVRRVRRMEKTSSQKVREPSHDVEHRKTPTAMIIPAAFSPVCSGCGFPWAQDKALLQSIIFTVNTTSFAATSKPENLAEETH